MTDNIFNYIYLSAGKVLRYSCSKNLIFLFTIYK